jgi:glutathione S-transferase
MQLLFTAGDGSSANLDDLLTAVRPVQLTALVVGAVEYREGDGVLLEIRRGVIDVEIAGTDAVLTWTDDDYRGAAAIPYVDFRRYVNAGDIRLPQ